MARRNQEIALAEASPGMVLSDDLLDAQGQVLLPAGATLTEAVIASLTRRGVDSLPIQGEEIEDENPALQEQHAERLAQVFRKHSSDDMATEILRQFVYQFRLGSAP